MSFDYWRRVFFFSFFFFFFLREGKEDYRPPTRPGEIGCDSAKLDIGTEVCRYTIPKNRERGAVMSRLCEGRVAEMKQSRPAAHFCAQT